MSETAPGRRDYWHGFLPPSDISLQTAVWNTFNSNQTGSGNKVRTQIINSGHLFTLTTTPGGKPSVHEGYTKSAFAGIESPESVRKRTDWLRDVALPGLQAYATTAEAQQHIAAGLLGYAVEIACVSCIIDGVPAIPLHKAAGQRVRPLDFVGISNTDAYSLYSRRLRGPEFAGNRRAYLPLFGTEGHPLSGVLSTAVWQIPGSETETIRTAILDVFPERSETGCAVAPLDILQGAGQVAIGHGRDLELIPMKSFLGMSESV